MNSKFRHNFNGILLPLLQDGGDDLDPHLLVRIIPELNQAFNTKERAPFKLVCEVVKLREVQGGGGGGAGNGGSGQGALDGGRERKEMGEDVVGL